MVIFFLSMDSVELMLCTQKSARKVDILFSLLIDLLCHFFQIIASLERNKLDEHRKIDACDDLNLVILQKRETQI